MKISVCIFFRYFMKKVNQWIGFVVKQPGNAELSPWARDFSLLEFPENGLYSEYLEMGN